MPARKMRVEIFDSEGNKYCISFEGNVTRDKALRILDIVELLGGLSIGETNNLNFQTIENSKYNKVLSLIQKHFPISWFSSRDIQNAYETEFKEPIGLSTVSTYLSRMVNKGLLLKTGNLNRIKYKTAPKLQNVLLK
ncbi:MAG: hypothetical protein N3F10_00480 [Candidatus Bathyarchaeota archaeon]|nr:hypothetical protein [Candidatus Bathyarchaeota archaeon]MCX8176767.1 hypothetical protein [Candidatus Bathyarchaeota archaeon]MDW8193296.1 hypothetical protein [Nitrososphaerota archaeon]